MNKLLLRFLATVLLSALAGTAHAVLNCTVSVGPLAFGAYTGVQVNSLATMTIACSRETYDKDRIFAYSAKLSPGGSNTYAQRKLTGGIDTLNYNIYLNSVPGTLNTSVWGDGTGGTIQATGIMDLSPPVTSKTIYHTVAGAVAAGPVPSPGSYLDSILVTVIYN